jgi:hypothetical protein
MTHEMYTWANDMYPLVKKRFEERYASRMDLIANIAGVVKQNELNYELAGLGGYGALPVYEGGELSYAGGEKAFITTVTPVERALALPVSYKKAKIDMVGEADRTGLRLADSAYMTVLSEFYRVFGNAFTAKGADGVAWASDAHPVDTDKKATFSNLITDELSVAAICAAQAKAAGFVTADGLPFVANFDLLLVSPALEAEARAICGEDALLTPAGGIGGKNGMKYMVCGGGSLGFTGKQWALADSMLLPEVLKLVYITEPSVVVSPRENPLMTDYIAYVDFAFGFGDARPIIFANPA